MSKKRDLTDLYRRLELVEDKLDILSSKVEESKRFSFDQLRDLLLRVMKLEESVKNIQTKIKNI